MVITRLFSVGPYDRYDYNVNWKRYVLSLYWATGTMTSTGFGEVRAVTVNEQAVSIIVMFLGIAVLFGMLLGGITSMLTNFDEQRGQYAHRFHIIKSHLVS